jgi:HK97 family phage major capsid protein
LIEYLRPMSVIRSLNPTIIPLDNGTATVPKMTGGASATYIGENQNATKTEPTFGNLKLTERKLAALVPISNDLVRNAAPSAVTVVRDDLAAALAQKSDLEFIRGDGTGAGPKGLRYWCPSANQLTVNATVNLANVTTDLGELILALRNANVRMLRCGWIMAPRTENYLMTIRDGNGNYAFRTEMLAGTLWGYPYKVTTQIPVNLAVTGTSESEVYFADFTDVIVGEASDLILTVSDEAAYHDGSNVVSAFSLDQTVIKAIERHDFGMRHDASVAVLTDVDWGA